MQAAKNVEAKHYTYADYASWDDEARYELIDGVPYIDGRPFTGVPGTVTMMSPPPSRNHQSISMEISGQLWDFLKGKPCEVYTAPFSVRLNAAYGDDNIVEPDIVVVCDKSKLDDKGCKGPPDMVVEILSPSSARLDRVYKFNKYLQAGVREYWIVDPDSRTVSVHVLDDGVYVAGAYTDKDMAPVSVLNGCRINLEGVFAKIQAGGQ